MNENRREQLSLVTDILEVAPSLRLGQLLGILTDRTDHPYTTNPVADVEDHELLPAARELLKDLRS
jgi:hypothetical protein